MKSRPSVGLIGFGKTGRAVASVLLESKQTELQWVLRRSTQLDHRSVSECLGIHSDEPGLIHSTQDLDFERLLDDSPVDVIVDFSSSTGLELYGKAAAQRGITIVNAISSYESDRVEVLRQLGRKTKVMYSPNITIGINFLILAAKVLKNIAPYTDIEIIEEHFKSKPEVSGTAKIIARNLDVGVDSIKTVRAGGIIGVHEILFGFPYQTVRLKHESITREAFGNGVLFAIENLVDRAVGFYTMEDLMLPYFQIERLPQHFLFHRSDAGLESPKGSMNR
jgi:4-hydroxy-tetrahydrodipicolinate reductase